MERALKVELTEHVGYEEHDPAGDHCGKLKKREHHEEAEGRVRRAGLRDRNGSFEPAIVSKGQTRFSGFDDKIISMYSRGMTTREIEGHLQEIYGVEVSPTLISNVTEGVMEELEGKEEILGLWAAQSEGAKFWLQVLTELQNRGVKDILIACVDGLKGSRR